MKTRIEFNTYPLYDVTGMVHHLEQKALHGWELDRIGMFWHYHRIEPEKLHYAAVFTDGSYYGAETEEERDFASFCEEAGWEQVGVRDTLKIFINRSEHPLPMDTDPEIQVKAIRTGVTKNLLMSVLLAIICCLLLFTFTAKLVSDPMLYLADSFGLILGSISVLVLLAAAIEWIPYLIWYRKAVKRAEQELFTPTRSYRWITTLIYLLALLSMVMLLETSTGGGLSFLLFLLLMMAGYYLVDIVVSRFKKKRIPGAVTVFVCWLIFFGLYMGQLNSALFSPWGDSKQYDRYDRAYQMEDTLLPYFASSDLADATNNATKDVTRSEITFEMNESILLRRMDLTYRELYRNPVYADVELPEGEEVGWDTIADESFLITGHIYHCTAIQAKASFLRDAVKEYLETLPAEYGLKEIGRDGSYDEYADPSFGFSTVVETEKGMVLIRMEQAPSEEKLKELAALLLEL